MESQRSVVVLVIVVLAVIAIAVPTIILVSGHSNNVRKEIITECSVVDKKYMPDEIRISKVAWMEIPKMVYIIRCRKALVYYTEICDLYGNCERKILNETVLKEWYTNRSRIIDAIWIRVDLDRYEEVWKKENPWLAKYVKDWDKKTVTLINVLGGKNGAWNLRFDVPIPVGIKNIVRYPYMSNDTYLRYVAVPAIKALAKFLNRTTKADLVTLLHFSLPIEYNGYNAKTGVWEYIIAEGGVCWQFARVGVALAHYLGFRAVILTVHWEGDIYHDVGFLCEPWYVFADTLEVNKAIIYLPNGTEWRCKQFVGTGAEHSLYMYRPAFIEIYRGYGRFVTIVPKKVVLYDIYGPGDIRTYTLRK